MTTIASAPSIREAMIPEFGLSVIDATLPIVEQQSKMREIVKPHLKGALRLPLMPYAEVLREESLTGRYMDEIEDEARES